MNLSYEQIQFLANSGVIDFGPPLPFKEICIGYTMEKMTLCQYVADNQLEMVLLRKSDLPRARVEGTLYHLSEEEIVELDKKRGVGVQCERKRIAVYLPYFHTTFGEMRFIYVYAYIAIKTFWKERTGLDRALDHVLHLGDRKLHLTDRLPDNNRFLNKRYCFLPSPITIKPVYTKGINTEGMRKLFESERRLMSLKDKFRQSLSGFKHRFSNFLDDE